MQENIFAKNETNPDEAEQKALISQISSGLLSGFTPAESLLQQLNQASKET